MALNFKPSVKELEIPWVNGAILIVRRPDIQELGKLLKKAKDEGLEDDTSVGLFLAKNHIVGWKNINTADGKKPLEFNEATLSQIFEEVRMDAQLLIKLTTFSRGILGNSPTG